MSLKCRGVLTLNVLGLSSILEPSAHLSEYRARKSRSALLSLNRCSRLVLQSSDTFSVVHNHLEERVLIITTLHFRQCLVVVQEHQWY
jgi:hypothetical protein